MIRLLRVFANSGDEDTVLNALRGLPAAKADRIFRCIPVAFVTLTTIFTALSINSALAGTQAATRSVNDPPLVALASSFRSVWPELVHAYLKENPERSTPSASFASTGLLSTQILRGAPFELFLSADKRSVDRITKAGKTLADPIVLAHGTLSAVTLPGTDKLSTNASALDIVRTTLTIGDKQKLAVPNPRHAPYGMAAQQALSAADLWPIPRGSLLQAENASQALQYVLSGAATVAIVPTTLITQSSFDVNSFLFPLDTYDPVIHHIALLSAANEEARKLNTWLQTPAALAIMMQFGLSAP